VVLELYISIEAFAYVTSLLEEAIERKRFEEERMLTEYRQLEKEKKVVAEKITNEKFIEQNRIAAEAKLLEKKREPKAPFQRKSTGKGSY
jgi:NAD kinase